MRPAFLSNNDYNNHYSASIYAAVPKSSTYYSRPVGFTFKTDSPKNSPTYSSRYNDNLKFAYKTEKLTDTSFERTPTREYSAPRTPTTTYQLGFYESDKPSNDQRTYFEPYKSTTNLTQYTPTRNYSASPLSRSSYLKEEDSPILTRRRFEDFDLELDNNSNSFLKTADSRPSSAKNSRFEDTSARKSQTSYNHIEDFISRYKATGGIQMAKPRENNDSSPRGYGLTRTNNANSSSQLMTSSLRSSLYADSNNSQSVANIKKPNNFFGIQDNNNETSRLKLYNNAPAFEYKKYDQKDSSELISSLNKPLLTRSEMNLLKTFDRNSNDNKPSLYASRVMGKTEQEDSPQRQPGEKLTLDSFITRVDRGASFLGSPKADTWYDSKSRPDMKDNSFYESEASTAMTNKTATQSPFKLSQGLLDRESKFYKDTERQKEIAKYNERSTRASSAYRHDESLESSPEDDRRKASSSTYYMTDMKRNLRTYGGDYFTQIYKEHFQQTFQALKLCKYMKNTDFRTLASKKVHLPRKDIHKNRKTLIFDLDETLIHCVDAPHKRSDVKLSIKFPDGERMEAGINVRPYAIECLRELNQYYEVMVFTASHKCYANAVLDYLDPHKQYIHHRLYRDSCVYTDEGVYVKDLRILANRDLHDVILVDNAAYSYGFQIENGVPIIPFYENKADQELKHLTTYLKQLSKENNLREVNKRTFKLHLYSQYNTQEEVMNRVFV